MPESGESVRGVTPASATDRFGSFLPTEDQILRAMRAVLRENTVTATTLYACVKGMMAPPEDRMYHILWDAIYSGEIVLTPDTRLTLADPELPSKSQDHDGVSDGTQTNDR